MSIIKSKQICSMNVKESLLQFWTLKIWIDYPTKSARLISNWDNRWTVIHATPIIEVMTTRHAQIWNCNMFKLFGKWVVTKCSWSLMPNKDLYRTFEKPSIIFQDLSISHPHVNVSHANKFKESNWMEFRSFPIQVDFPMLEYVLKHIFVCIKHHQD
jgi:hypothetical protein